MVKQAKSKQKILDKMEAAGLTPPVQHESTFHFQFPDCDKLPPPVLPFQDVSFAYSGQDKDCLYRVRLSYCSSNVVCLISCVLTAWASQVRVPAALFLCLIKLKNAVATGHTVTTVMPSQNTIGICIAQPFQR